MRRRALLAASMQSGGGGGITIEKGLYYPDLAEYLIDKYGLDFGRRSRPIAIEEDIFIGSSFATGVGVGQVKFLYISDIRSTVGILLYLEDYEDTYYCVSINNQTEHPYYGQTNLFMWD